MEPGRETTAGVARERRVLVTFAADEGARALVAATLGDLAAVTYLDDVAGARRVAELSGADAYLSWVVGAELGDDVWAVLAGFPAARPLLVQTLSAGVDHVPFASLPAGVTVAGNAGGWAEPMAEHVLAMILALAKRLLVEQDELRRGTFNQEAPTRELRGGTCAILGLGGSGRAVARLVRALGMRVVALNSGGATTEPVDFVGTLADLEHVLRPADVVVVTLRA
jgi:phosphoglycerate dehydrogenase-like enzyme